MTRYTMSHKCVWSLPESIQSLYVWVFLKWDFIGVPWVPIGFLCLILKTPWDLRSFRVYGLLYLHTYTDSPV